MTTETAEIKEETREHLTSADRGMVNVAFSHKGQYVRFELPLAGLTLRDALEEIRVHLWSYYNLTMKAPYYLNKEEIDSHSNRIVRDSDHLCVDP